MESTVQPKIVIEATVIKANGEKQELGVISETAVKKETILKKLFRRSR